MKGRICMDYLIQTKASDWLIFVLVRISSLGHSPIKGCDSNFEVIFFLISKVVLIERTTLH